MKKSIELLFVFADGEPKIRNYTMPETLRGCEIWQDSVWLSEINGNRTYDVMLFSAKIRPGQICDFVEKYGKTAYVISYYPFSTKRTRHSEEIKRLLDSYSTCIDEFKKSGISLEKFFQQK